MHADSTQVVAAGNSAAELGVGWMHAVVCCQVLRVSVDFAKQACANLTWLAAGCVLWSVVAAHSQRTAAANDGWSIPQFPL
jgi:hypothetical protein